jgi:hypothetical protein
MVAARRDGGIIRCIESVKARHSSRDRTAIVADARTGSETTTSQPHHRTLRICDKMLTRSLFTFATLSLFAVSAIAQDIPAKLVPPQDGPLVSFEDRWQDFSE